MTPSRLTAWAQRKQRDPAYFARWQAVFVGCLFFGVVAVIAWGDWLSWLLLGSSLAGLVLSVPGELDARRAIEHPDGGEGS